jgi:hypothetical protein
MSIETNAITSGSTELDGFVQRALLDFGLSEAYELRSARERVGCLLWIALAGETDEVDLRVSALLDALDSGSPLPGA